MDIQLQTITIKDIKEGIKIEKDDHGLYENDFLVRRKNIFLNNPFWEDDMTAAAYLIRANGVVVGHLFPFPTRIKVGNQIVSASSASDLFVIKEYNQYAAGADLVMAPIRDKRFSAIILADISADGMDCYHAFRFHDFALPKMIQPRNSQFIFQNYGLKGAPMRVTSGFVNVFLKPLICLSNLILRRYAAKYKIVKMTKVPAWVDNMVMNDGHKYAEVHDQKWLQWCLDNTTFCPDDHKKYFYAIYNKQSQPIGFFVNYEVVTNISNRNINNLKQGTVMEWGSYDEKKFSEYDITRIAIASFSRDLSLVQFASLNQSVLKKMRKYGCIRHNYHHVVVKDTSKKLKDISDPDLWRLRFGYADSLF